MTEAEESLNRPSADPDPAADSAASGSDPVWDSPAPIASDLRVDDARVLPTRTDGLVREASSLVGGPVGTHAVIGRARHLTPLRVLFALALCGLALGWFGKAACLQQAPADGGTTANAEMRLDWDDQRQFTNLCYSDVISLFGAERLNRGALPYRDFWFQEDSDGQTIKRYMEYPVLTGMFMYGAAQLTQGWLWAETNWGVPGALDVVLFFTIVALGLTAFWLVTIWATALTARHRTWSVWLVALSPLVFVHAFTNFDAIATAAVATALLAWSRERFWLAGVLIGLGTAAKLYPALLLVVLGVLCLRTGKVREFGVAAATAIGAWLAVNLPILIPYPSGWWEFFRFNGDRSADPDTIYRVVADAAGFTWNIGYLNALSVGLTVVVIAAVVAVGVLAPYRPRVAQLAFLAVAGFLLVNKVWSPQYSLWLVPLAVLAIPHTRLLLAWMAVDALIWVPRMSLFLDAERRWLPDQWFTAAVVLRGLMVVVLCAVVLWQIWHPRDDLVRHGNDGRWYDDPAGGVLDGAPDRIGRRSRATQTAEDPREPVPAAG
ncbi:glycosyltransferase family 87 protein [Gordonia sp. KTR9]|uniref:glycosyltransferase family 87 protein n=1 Tax=Gordonia sp. KTR9 TaxID=337191 RepID=UPI00027DDFC6|nr:glycosyltransferase 87 family protein [Gordonia sp. KTR9]AFR51208.1 putative integral membrane protein [Gordonia sp. KTR9]